MKKSIWAAFFWGCLAIFGCIVPSMRAMAAEGLVLAGPIGGPNLGAALLPSPGLYLGLADVNATTAHLINGEGQRIFPDSEWTRFFSLSVPVLYVYPQEVFGGRIASSLLMTYVDSCLQLAAGQKSCPQGLGDPYVDLFIWSRTFSSASTQATSPSPPGAPPIPYGLTIAAGLGVSVPIGPYNKTALLSPGNNYWDVAPNVALTYIAPGLIGNATEFSVRVFYNYYTRNSAQDYTSGPILDAAGAVSEGFGPLKIGMAYDYHIQVAADYSQGQSIGNRNQGASVGPVVSYDFMLAKHPIRLKVRDFRNIYSRNNLETNTLVMSIVTRF